MVGSPPVMLTPTSGKTVRASSTVRKMSSGSRLRTVVTSSRMQWGQRRLQCSVTAMPRSMEAEAGVRA
jgi:hypothetical protein